MHLPGWSGNFSGHETLGKSYLASPSWINFLCHSILSASGGHKQGCGIGYRYIYQMIIVQFVSGAGDSRQNGQAGQGGWVLPSTECFQQSGRVGPDERENAGPSHTQHSTKTRGQSDTRDESVFSRESKELKFESINWRLMQQHLLARSTEVSSFYKHTEVIFIIVLEVQFQFSLV